MSGQIESIDFRVDMSTNGAMSKEARPTPRQIVGISLPPETASRFKAEAGRRNISLKHLFEEMWKLYEEQPAEKKAKS